MTMKRRKKKSKRRVPVRIFKMMVKIQQRLKR